MKTLIDVRNNVRLLSLIMIAVLALPLVTSAQAGKIDFTGSWTLNADKSTMGDGPRMGGGDFTAKQEGNALTVDRSFTTRDGQTINSTMKYTLDGKESVNTSPRGDSKSVASWSADGKILTIKTSRTFNMNGESRTMNSTEVWTMTDPRTITINSTMTTPNGDRTTTMVYDRK